METIQPYQGPRCPRILETFLSGMETWFWGKHPWALGTLETFLSGMETRSR